MNEIKVPELLTPDLLKILVANADTLKDMISSGEEQTLLDGVDSNGHLSCCCPRLIKIKSVLCNVFVYNYNAAAQNDVDSALLDSKK